MKFPQKSLPNTTISFTELHTALQQVHSNRVFEPVQAEVSAVQLSSHPTLQPSRQHSKVVLCCAAEFRSNIKLPRIENR